MEPRLPIQGGGRATRCVANRGDQDGKKPCTGFYPILQAVVIESTEGGLTIRPLRTGTRHTMGELRVLHEGKIQGGRTIWRDRGMERTAFFDPGEESEGDGGDDRGHQSWIFGSRSSQEVPDAVPETLQWHSNASTPLQEFECNQEKECDCAGWANGLW